MSSRRKKKLRPAEIMTVNLAICDLGISGNTAMPFLLWGLQCPVIKSSLAHRSPYPELLLLFFSFTNHLFRICGKSAECCLAVEIVHLVRIESFWCARCVRCWGYLIVYGAKWFQKQTYRQAVDHCFELCHILPTLMEVCEASRE